MRVVPAMIPERFVPAQNSIVLEAALPAVVQTVNSRGRVSKVLSMYNLYPGERAHMPAEAVIERMRKAIRISSGTESSVEVSFTYPDRVVAQKVATELASRIILEHKSCPPSRSF